jgi:hypothetical protein
LQGLANEWGRGFIGEFGYCKETQSTIMFNDEAMKQRKLDAVTASIALPEYSAKQVLVM